MRRVKDIVEPEKTYTIFEQRQPLKKQHGPNVVYEANLVKVGELKAKSSHDALDVAKKLGISDKPVVHGTDTEGMRDIYNRPKRHYED